MRKPHILRHNHSARFPQKILFYDTETEGEKINDTVIKHHFNLVSSCFVTKTDFKDYDSMEKKIYADKKLFWQYVISKTQKKETLVLIAHNQNWDFIALDGFNELVKHGWNMKGAVIDKDIWIIRFTKGDRKIVVYDSFNWFRIKIAEMGKTVGIPKLTIDFNNHTKEELIEYCLNDTMILTTFFGEWINFLKDHDFGNFKATIASQAFSCYTHRFMNHEIFIHNNQRAIDLERDSFRGGANICFRLGQYREKIYDLDFVSMYPSEMKEQYYPTRLRGFKNRTTERKLIELMEDFAVIAKVKIKMDKPIIAYRQEKLIFPIGTFTLALTSPELQYVLKHGEILQIYDLAFYEQQKIFTDYVNYFVDLKLKYAAEENPVYEKNAKMLLCSLYGRFGLKIWDKLIIGDCSINDIGNEIHYSTRTKEARQITKFGGKVFLKEKTFREGNDSFVAIPSFVTAYARLKLWKLIYLAGLENTFYCDTDSIFVNMKGYNKIKHLINPKELGKLKIEAEGKRLNIFGCKDYELDDKIKIKGIKDSAIKLADGLYQQERFLKIKSLLRKGQLDTPQIELITKQLKRIYDKGEVLPNGRVIPFILTE